MPNTPGVADHAANPEADARNRALRTFLQGLALDVALAVALIVYSATSAEHVEWRLLLLTLAKTAVQTAASYVMRKLSPPAVAS
jgi:hypothetical protein